MEKITFSNVPYVIEMPNATRAYILSNVLSNLTVAVSYNGVNLHTMLIKPADRSLEPFKFHQVGLVICFIFLPSKSIGIALN